MCRRRRRRAVACEPASGAWRVTDGAWRVTGALGGGGVVRGAWRVGRTQGPVAAALAAKAPATNSPSRSTLTSSPHQQPSPSALAISPRHQPSPAALTINPRHQPSPAALTINPAINPRQCPQNRATVALPAGRALGAGSEGGSLDHSTPRATPASRAPWRAPCPIYSPACHRARRVDPNAPRQR